MSLSHHLPAASRRRSRRPGAGRPSPRPPAPVALRALPERDYWVEHCEGFRVDGARGRIGIVEEVRQSPEGGRLLAIRTGVLGRKVVLISTREVFEIVPRARRLWLRTPESAPAPAAAAADRAESPSARVAA